MRYSNDKRRFVLGLALSVALMTSGSTMAFAKDAQELEKVDFVSLNGATEINLYAGEGIKHKAISVSENKLVIDLKGVNVTKTVRTNFSHARNVDNIVFQPLSNEKIRLIIRGHHLGRPLIAFKAPKNPIILDNNSLASSRDGKLLIDEAKTSQDEALVTLATESTESSVSSMSSIDTDALKPAVLDTEISGAAANIDFTEINNQALNKPLSLQSKLTPAATTSLSFNNALGLSGLSLENLPTLPIPLPQAGMVLGLLIGLGIFIKRKLSSLAVSRVEEPQAISGQKEFSKKSKKRLSFRELANQQNSPSESEQQAQRELFSPNNHPKKANKWASDPARKTKEKPLKNRSNLVGLSSLFETQEPLPKSRPASSQQALNQYQKQATPPLPSRASRASAKKQTSAQKPPVKPQAKPIRSSKTTAPKQKPVANHPLNPTRPGVPKSPVLKAQAPKTPKAPSAPSMSDSARQQLAKKVLNQPQPNNNEPIPENTKVLDFLKNVAERMEQDGDHDKVQQINKGIRRGFNQ